MALNEREEMKEHMEEIDEQTGDNLDDRRMQVCHAPLLPSCTAILLAGLIHTSIAIRQSLLPPPVRTKTYRIPLSARQLVRNRHPPPNRSVPVPLRPVSAS